MELKHNHEACLYTRQENVTRLLALREVCPNVKRTRRKLWAGSTSNSKCCGPGGYPVIDLRKALELWLEADSIRNCTAKYCNLNPAPRSTIAAAFSPDGSSLASTHGDHTVKIICCRTGACLKVLYGHRRTPWVVRFHPQIPQIVASGSLDNEVRLWDIATADCFRAHDFGRPIASLAFHPHGDILAVASGHKLYIWQYKKREERSQPVIVLRTRKTLRAVHFHPYGAPLLLTAEVDWSESPPEQATSRPVSRFSASSFAYPPHSASLHLNSGGFSPMFSSGGWLFPTLRIFPRVFSTCQPPGNDCPSREGMMVDERTAAGHHHQGGSASLDKDGAHPSSSSVSDARTAGGEILEGVRGPEQGAAGGEGSSHRVSALRKDVGSDFHPSPMEVSPTAGGPIVGSSGIRMDWDGVGGCPESDMSAGVGTNPGVVGGSGAPESHVPNGDVGAHRQGGGLTGYLSHIPGRDNSGGPASHRSHSSRSKGTGEKAAGMRGGGGSARHNQGQGGSGQALGGGGGRGDSRGYANHTGSTDRLGASWGAWGAQTGVTVARHIGSPAAENSSGLGLGGPGSLVGGWEIPFVQRVLQESQQAAASIPSTMPRGRGNEGAGGGGQRSGGTRNEDDRSRTAQGSHQQSQHVAASMASVAMAAAMAAARAAARAGAGVLGAAGAGIGAGIGAQIGAGAALGAAALNSGAGGDAATDAASIVQLNAAGAAGAAAVVSMQALASAQAAESPCTVLLRIWPHDAETPSTSLLPEKCRLIIPHAVLCSEMGTHFSPCGRFLAACVACVPSPDTEVRPGSSGTGNSAGLGQGSYGQRSPLLGPCRPVSARDLMYELRVYSLEKQSFGQVLASRAVRAAHCLTSIQISPTSSHVLLAYGRRHNTLLKSFTASGTQKQLIPVYTILEIYRISDMSLVGVLPSADDEVNVACFHSWIGGGLVYGTKEGRLRLLVHDRHRRFDCQSGFEDDVIQTRMVDDLHFGSFMEHEESL